MLWVHLFLAGFGVVTGIDIAMSIAGRVRLDRKVKISGHALARLVGLPGAAAVRPAP